MSTLKIIDVAVSQLGTKERELNEIKYNQWYYNRRIAGGSYPYCAVFISWCADQAGLSTSIIPKTASVKSMYDFYNSQGKFIDKSMVPSVGDILICRNGASHVGLIETVDNAGVWVIEGISGKGIIRSYYSYSNPSITGYAKPDYPEEITRPFKLVSSQPMLRASTTTDNTTEALKTTMTADQIYDYFRFRGYSEEASAGIVAAIRVNSGYSNSYKPVKSFTIGGMGLFAYDFETQDETSGDLKTDRQKYPNSRLAKYLDWCDKKGYTYESSGSQLEYFWEVDRTERLWAAQSAELSGWSPSDLNDTSAEDVAAKFSCFYISNDFSTKDYPKERTAAKEILRQYKDRTVPTENPTGASVSSIAAPIAAGAEKISAATKNMRTGNMKFQTAVGSYTYITYVVKDGDTLESIALKYNVAPQMIFFANNLETWTISVGQELKVPQVANIMTREEQIEGVEELENLIHKQSVTVSHPTVEINFYGEYGKLAVTSTLNPTSQEHFEQDIISVTTKRDMGQDCPTFMIQLVWRNDWYNKLASNDMLTIEMWRPPEQRHIVMYGLIDDIRRSTDWSSLQPKRTLQITGRGFNKALCQFDIGVLENYTAVTEVERGFFYQLQSMQGVSSSGAIGLVLDAYINKGMKYKFGNDKTLLDYMVRDFKDYPNEILYEITSFTSFYGNMWNFIKQLGNAPWNETYWEIGDDDKLHLVHRPTPFTKSYWIELPRKTIEDDELVSNNTGRSDLETYTVYQCNQIFLGQDTKNPFLAIWYPPYYPKYGLRQLSRTTVYEVNHEGYNSRVFTIDLFNFYIKNNVFENGQITVKGSNRFKVGERLLLDSTGMEYYIEAVTHSFTMYDSWTTTLSVTRGIHPIERFTPPYGAAEDLTVGAMQALITLTKDGKVDWTQLQKYARSVPSQSRVSTKSASATDSLYDFRGITFNSPVEKSFEDVQANCITSPFGWRIHPTYGDRRLHTGIDIAFEGCEGAKILAAADGTVTIAGPLSGYGNYISIDHGNGIFTGYGHMYDGHIYVKVGDTVKAGQHIADIGSAGVSTGAHLHYEIRIDGQAVDPITAYQTRKQAEFSDINNDSPPSEVTKAVYQYLTGDMGMSKSAACAVMGNIQQESGFILSNKNESSGAFGLCQWLRDRYDGLINYCNSQGLDVLSVAGQMGWFKTELSSTESAAMSALQGVEDTESGVYDAAVKFGEAYERYGTGEEGNRGTYAVSFYKSM